MLAIRSLAHAAGQFLNPRAPPPGPNPRAAQPLGDVVVDEPAHAGQLPCRAEIVDKGHVRVSAGPYRSKSNWACSMIDETARISTDDNFSPVASSPR